MDKLVKFALVALTLVLFACGGDSATVAVEQPGLGVLKLGNCKIVERDDAKRRIEISKTDSVVVDSIQGLGGATFYMTLDADLVDPSIDWDNPVKNGMTVSLADTNAFSIVVLDGSSRTVAVWLIEYAKESGESSSSEVALSSSENDSESSSSKDTGNSSSNDAESSSSKKDPEPAEESSSSVESSSSAEESSSSVESSSSAVNNIKASELSVEKGSVTVDGNKIYVELPYGTDLSKVKLLPLDTVNNLTRAVEMELENESGELAKYSVVAGVQLPGSSFDDRVDSFWGTTSDAMAAEGTGKYKVPVLGVTVTVSMKSDSANLYFVDSQMKLITQSVVGHSTGFDGGWKMASGFYFAGSYTGVDGASIYQADNAEAGADNAAADFSQYMEFGRPFTARPQSFDVTYAYNHVDNANDSYEQKSLIYVVLVSANKKIVAAGSIMDDASVDMATKTVKLAYGSDAGLLEAGVAGVNDLSVGKGDEDIASIRVMFASSAYAFVADGGSSSQMKAHFRGAEGAELIVDDFKLVY